LQYECIGCAACIDGCNQVMERVGYPRGLIRYSTTNALEGGWTLRQMVRRAFRPRVLIYAAVLWAIILAAAVSLYMRVPLKVDVIRDRASLTREVEGGMIENVYRLQIMNTEEVPHRYRVSAEGLTSLQVVGDGIVEAPPASTIMVPIKLRVEPGRAGAGSHKIEFVIRAEEAEGIAAREKSVFLVR